jgi:hypothetical protein
VKQIIIHIGLHKTGTTSIQKTLGLNCENLANEGYCYPTFRFDNREFYNHSSPLLSLYLEKPLTYHMNVRFGIDSFEKLQNQHRCYLEQLASALNTDHSTVIFSGEGLSVLSLDGIKKFKRDMEEMSTSSLSFRIVCCVREPVAFWTSDFQQRVKGGIVSDKFLDEKTKDHFYSRLHNYVEIFGFSSLNVYSFEEAMNYPQGICSFFLKRAAPGLNWTPTADNRVNESLCKEAVELILYINKCAGFWVEGEICEGRISGDLNPLFTLQGKTFSLSAGKQRKIIDDSRCDRQWLNKHFGIEYSDREISVPAEGDSWKDVTLSQLREVIKKLKPHFRGLVVNYLRDKAIECEKIDFEKAYRLMNFCRQQRPKGPLINKKITQYEKIMCSYNN